MPRLVLEQVDELPGRAAESLVPPGTIRVQIGAPAERVFAYGADPATLPEWTHAFASAGPEGGVMRTPNGETEVELDVTSSRERGTVDWRMAFPDGSAATAFSRVVPFDRERSVFSFVLTAPPVPLEQLEGALEEQSRILTDELAMLKRVLEEDRERG